MIYVDSLPVFLIALICFAQKFWFGSDVSSNAEIEKPHSTGIFVTNIVVLLNFKQPDD